MDQDTLIPKHIEDEAIQEWLESLDSVLESSGPDVAREILERLRAHATVLNSSRFRRLELSLSPPFPGRQYRGTPSHVPHESRMPGSRHLCAGHHLASNPGNRQAQSRAKL